MTRYNLNVLNASNLLPAGLEQGGPLSDDGLSARAQRSQPGGGAEACGVLGLSRKRDQCLVRVWLVRLRHHSGGGVLETRYDSVGKALIPRLHDRRAVFPKPGLRYTSGRRCADVTAQVGEEARQIVPRELTAEKSPDIRFAVVEANF